MALLTSGPLSEALHLSEDGVDVLDGMGVGAGEGAAVVGVAVLGVAVLNTPTAPIILAPVNVR